MQNPQTKQRFAQTLAQSSFSDVDVTKPFMANDMTSLMQQLNQNNSIVDPNVSMQQLSSMYGGNNSNAINEIQQIQQRNTLFNINDYAEETNDMIFEIQNRLNELNNN